MGRCRALLEPDDVFHVLYRSALATDRMMMIVADTGFIARGAARRLKAPQETSVRQAPGDLVCGLCRQRPDSRTGRGRDRLDVGMAPELGDDPQDRDA
jgi:hypothetical protein